MGLTLKAGETSTYIMSYILDENQVRDKYRLTIYTGEAQKSKDFMAITYNVNLNPTDYFGVDVVRNANLNEPVSFSSTFLNNTSLTIKNIEIANRYEYQYESCYRDNCRNYTGLVLAGTNGQSGQTLMILDYDFTIDEETSAYQNIKTISDFTNQFITVEYTIGDTTYSDNVVNLTPNRVKDKLILQATDNIKRADNVNILVTIRNRCYKIKVK